MAKAKGGQPGNRNAAKGRIWSDAVRRAVLQGDKLNELAEALIREALDGDVVALKEIGDRLEGKVAQPVTGEDGPVELVVTWRAPS